MTTILMVEDEVNLLNSLSFILEAAGYRVLGANTGGEALAIAAREPPDLVLLDLGLPDMDGFDVAAALQPLRRERGALIVVLTASGLEDHMVRALDTCADDYVEKPVRPRALLARLGALQRRAGRGTTDEGALRFGTVVLDPDAHAATLEGQPLDLTRTEFRLLLALARHANRALDRAALIREVHGPGCVVTDRCIDFQVHGLRRKLGSEGRRLETVRGVGFRLARD